MVDSPGAELLAGSGNDAPAGGGGSAGWTTPNMWRHGRHRPRLERLNIARPSPKHKLDKHMIRATPENLPAAASPRQRHPRAAATAAKTETPIRLPPETPPTPVR